MIVNYLPLKLYLRTLIFFMAIRTYLFISVLLFLGFFSYSQNRPDFPKIKVTGIIIDKESQKPLEYATITFTHTRFPKIVGGGITNSKGEFEASIPAGSYNIKADFISFKSFMITDRTLTANAVIETIALEEGLLLALLEGGRQYGKEGVSRTVGSIRPQEKGASRTVGSARPENQGASRTAINT